MGDVVYLLTRGDYEIEVLGVVKGPEGVTSVQFEGWRLTFQALEDRWRQDKVWPVRAPLQNALEKTRVGPVTVANNYGWPQFPSDPGFAAHAAAHAALKSAEDQAWLPFHESTGKDLPNYLAKVVGQGFAAIDSKVVNLDGR